MSPVAVAFAAQVSSAPPAHARTLTIHVVALRARIAQTRAVLNWAPEFIHPGDGGATFIHPTLERRQEAVAARGGEPAAGYLPDRLVRQAADQVRGGVGFPRPGRRLLVRNPLVGKGLERTDAPLLPWRYRSPRPSPRAITVTALVPAVTPRRPL
jgi:hypothetical protein